MYLLRRHRNSSFSIKGKAVGPKGAAAYARNITGTNQCFPTSDSTGDLPIVAATR